MRFFAEKYLLCVENSSINEKSIDISHCIHLFKRRIIYLTIFLVDIVVEDSFDLRRRKFPSRNNRSISHCLVRWLHRSTGTIEIKITVAINNFKCVPARSTDRMVASAPSIADSMHDLRGRANNAF